MKFILLLFVSIMLLNCSDRTITESMWKSDSYYYKIEGGELSESQIIDLDKTVNGYRIIKSGTTYYIKKNWIQQYGEISVKVLATPATVSFDAASIIVVGAVSDPKFLEIILKIAVESTCHVH